MRWTLAAAAAAIGAAAIGSAGTAARSNSRPPLYDPVFLNIGFVCRWEPRCMDRQDDAMRRALKFVRKKNPPTWRVELCNKNAGRRGQRVDWIGFEHCIRNEVLRPQPRPAPRARRPRTMLSAERGL
jgi:hypothetical protein